MAGYNYKVIFEKDIVESTGESVVSVSCPALHCHTWGKTRKEAEEKIAEAIHCTLESMKEEGEPIPQEAGDEGLPALIYLSIPPLKTAKSPATA